MHRPAFPPRGGDRYRRSCRWEYQADRQPGAWAYRHSVTASPLGYAPGGGGQGERL